RQGAGEGAGGPVPDLRGLRASATGGLCHRAGFAGWLDAAGAESDRAGGRPAWAVARIGWRCDRADRLKSRLCAWPGADRADSGRAERAQRDRRVGRATVVRAAAVRAAAVLAGTGRRSGIQRAGRGRTDDTGLRSRWHAVRT